MPTGKVGKCDVLTIVKHQRHGKTPKVSVARFALVERRHIETSINLRRPQA